MDVWLRNISGKILTGKNRSTWRNTCPSVTLSTGNLTCTGLKLNPGLCSEKMVTDRLSHDTAALFRRILDAAIRMNNPNGLIRAVRCDTDVPWGWRPMRATCCDTDVQWGWRPMRARCCDTDVQWDWRPMRATYCDMDVQWGCRPMRATRCDTDVQWGWRWPFWWECILE